MAKEMMYDPITEMTRDDIYELAHICEVKYGGQSVIVPEFQEFYRAVTMGAQRDMITNPLLHSPEEIWSSMDLCTYRIMATVFLTGWEAALRHIATRKPE
jgi:hypothetical protein